jgi:hypothetical protein
MNKKSLEMTINTNIIETAFNEENIHSLLEALTIGTSRNIYIIKEITAVRLRFCKYDLSP